MHIAEGWRRKMRDPLSDFDSWSKTYERSWMQRMFDTAHRAVLSAVGADLRVERLLDVGCGTGRLLRKARERWPQAELIGVDASEGMIAQAHELTPGAELHVALAEALPLADGSVDLAFTTASFHHWSDKLQGVREIARVLRSGGQFCLADVKISPLLAKVVALFSPRHAHARANTPALVRQMFAEAGLEVLEQKTSGGDFLITGKKP
jgi:ubiquinone/menaquinone biosynthesis C-methylase UbiE